MRSLCLILSLLAVAAFLPGSNCQSPKTTQPPLTKVTQELKQSTSTTVSTSTASSTSSTVTISTTETTSSTSTSSTSTTTGSTMSTSASSTTGTTASVSTPSTSASSTSSTTSTTGTTGSTVSTTTGSTVSTTTGSTVSTTTGSTVSTTTVSTVSTTTVSTVSTTAGSTVSTTTGSTVSTTTGSTASTTTGSRISTTTDSISSTSTTGTTESTATTTTGPTVSTTTGSTVSTTSGSTPITPASSTSPTSSTTGSSVSTTTGSTPNASTSSTISTAPGSTPRTSASSTSPTSTTTMSTTKASTPSTSAPTSTMTGSTSGPPQSSTASSTTMNGSTSSTISTTEVMTPSTMESTTISACQLPSGNSCFFPFVYNGITYNTCTDVDDSQLWCPTTLYSSGVARDYEYCPASCIPVQTSLVTPSGPTCVLPTGLSCIFPFIYNGVTYNGCTEVDDTKHWCATSLYANGYAQDYDYCTSSCLNSITTQLTTSESSCVLSDGRPCVFPFKYQNVAYNSCTDIDDSRPWCATSLYSSGNANEFGYCPSSCSTSSTTVVTEPTTGNSCKTNSGQTCIFPFTYEGISYTGCTTADDTRPWCAFSLYSSGLARDYDYCSKECEVDIKETTLSPPEGCKTSGGDLCIFPFMYTGQTYSECTPVDNNGQAWCATSVKPNLEYANYGNCEDSCPGSVISPPTDNINTRTCLTDTGKSCVFPFTYNGVSYTACTDADDSRNWCATSLYGSGGVKDYGYCPESCDKENSIPSDSCRTTSDLTCVFPFVYNGQRYTSCTTADNAGIPWCATRVETNLNYVEYGLCSSSCL